MKYINKKIKTLFSKYASYIKNDCIENYIYLNINILRKKENMDKFAAFLVKCSKYGRKKNGMKNTTYIYFRGLYYYCNEQYNTMLSLLEGIDESNCLYLVGLYYHTKKTDGLSFQMAIGYYEEASLYNNSNAYRRLATIYGNQKMYKQKNIYYKKSAKLKNDLAMVSLGYYYRKKNKYDLAMKYFRDAARLNNPEAHIELGKDYLLKNKKTLMLKHYLIAFMFNEPHAINLIALHYKNIRNYDMMKYYLRIGIKRKNTYSMEIMGNFYKSSLHGQQNNKLAKEYYHKVYDLSPAKGGVLLGNYYRYIENNYTLMKKYYQIAIKQKSSEAICKLSSYYMIKEKNNVLMEKYYMIGIQQWNCKKSMKLLLYYYQKDYKQHIFYKNVYYPRILTLVICNARRNIFLPAEILNCLIFNSYINNNLTFKH